MKAILAAAFSFLAASGVEAQRWRGGKGHGHGWGQGGKWHGWNPPGRDLPAPVAVGNSTFTQLIDHKNPHLGTFQQFYYYSTTYWKGPGSPVVFLTPGEIAAEGYEGYLGNRTLSGAVAQKIGAAVVVMEHRYWGRSSPFTELSTANMQYLTLDNSIKDFTNFAKTANLPWETKHGPSSNSDAVPWVMIGGSYAGALTGWTASLAPGTFWSYISSSGVVETISDFWQYFLPVQEGMPKNCSADVSRVVDYMDKVLKTGSAQQIHDLKDKFGLADVEHADDFMSVLENGPWGWQSTDFASSGGFFQWCDYVENSVNQTNPALLPGADGVGLTKALDGYATWTKDILLPNYCQEFYGYSDFAGEDNHACFNTYNKTSILYTDTSVSNAFNRQWWWFLCNEPFGWWQDGAPSGRSSIVSRLVGPEYSTRQCAMLFPTGPQGQTYGLNKGDSEEQTNAYTGGWFIDNTTRLIYTNGEWDPWRYATVSSDFRPGGRLQSTKQVPVNVIPEGRHCSDLILRNGDANAGCKAVQNAEIAQIAAWVKEFPRRHHWKA